MRIVEIEWKHLDVSGETCDRCLSTGESLKQKILELKDILASQQIQIILKESKLKEERVNESNEVYIDGEAIENIIDVRVDYNYCASCSTLTNKDISCRSIVYNNHHYDEIPSFALHDAILKKCGFEKEISAMKAIHL